MEINKRMFRFLSYDLIRGVGIFWTIMLLVDIAPMVISLSKGSDFIQGPMIINQGSISFVASNFFPIFIFFVIYSLEMYYEKFSLAVGFGGTRKRFYQNLIINNIIVVLIFATIQTILLKLENLILSNSTIKPIVDFGWFNIKSDSILQIILTLSFVFLTLVSITNLIGVLQYRYSYKFWISLGIFILIIIRTSNLIGRFISRIIYHMTNIDYIIPNPNIVLVGVLIIIVTYTLGFIFIRKANIK